MPPLQLSLFPFLRALARYLIALVFLKEVEFVGYIDIENDYLLILVHTVN